MKYILSFLGVGIVVLAIFLCGGQGTGAMPEEDYMRIHIQGNSNSSADQKVKYVVKDAVVEFLIPLMSEATCKEEAQAIITSNISKIEEVVNVTLRSEGASYSGTVKITTEDMPARTYEQLTLDEGVYDSLSITLGQGHGDNWWCVVFPAVCFINSKNSQNVEYISKILEIINSVTKN